MAKIIEFPTFEYRIAEEARPAINHVMDIVVQDTLRHLQRHYPELLQEHGSELLRVWSTFMLDYMAKVSLLEATKTLGAEKFHMLLEELTRK